MRAFRVLQELSMSKVRSEWDTLAPVRLKQILSGADVTFNEVLLPAIIDLVEADAGASALDAGCGVGVLTDYLTTSFKDVVGLDPSTASVDIARITSPSATIYNCTLEQFSASEKRRFNLITANMVLMDAPNLFAFCKAASDLLKPGGALVFSITHPAFWPDYYGYSSEPWFAYNKELIIESPFRISAEPDCRMVSTHIHRPIERYVLAIAAAGLTIDRMDEPFPESYVQSMYPTRWTRPRYLVARCRKGKSVR